jgi:RHS repeat-associated protein
LDAEYGWDKNGRMTWLKYPGEPPGYANPPQYTYAYDPMGRLSLMKEDGLPTATAAYGVAGQITDLTYFGVTERRTYNELFQLTQIDAGSMMKIDYRYTVGQNNGRISQSMDHVTGEEVTYTYDALNRLVRAETTDTAWGTTYTYDGFGNLTAKTWIKGSAPPWSSTVDAATNRLGNATSYDANGNPLDPQGLSPFDVENRRLSPAGDFAGWTYDPSGKRVFGEKARWHGVSQTTCELYFYGITGQKLATYSCGYNDQDGGDHTFFYRAKTRNVYFAGKLVQVKDVIAGTAKTIVTDRLGSVRAAGTDRMSYYPYGEERTSTANGREKFGTYFRDGDGLDYAEQRDYASASGRFLTPDPSTGVNLRNPASWNKYLYVLGDPVTFTDRTGLLVDECEFDQTGECEANRSGVRLSILPGVRSIGEAGHLPTAILIQTMPGAPRGGSGGMPQWQANVVSGLAKIASGGFKANADCASFFVQLASGLSISSADLMSAVQTVAADAEKYVYDGPSSTTSLDPVKFPGAAASGAKTVGDWFRQSSGTIALSQFNGSAIFLDSSDWSGGMFSPFVSSGSVNQYGLGTLMHELLHKQMVGGGFLHSQLTTALDAVGARAAALGRSGTAAISDRIGSICF